jgi:uncharacterized protein (DUF1330 family)
MPAYVVVDIEVLDPTRYEDYKRVAPPAIAALAANTLRAGGGWKSSKGPGLPNGSSF